MRIGFIGLGNMGGPMATNLLKAGHELVVNDIDEAKTAPHREMGATWADTPVEVARQAPVVLTSLPGPAEVEDVALGAEGLIQGLQPGSVYADLSTGSPTRIRQVAERIEAMGAHMLDAPVSGGTIGAEEGTLAVMVGGDEEVFEAVRPVFEAIGTGVSYVGPIGSGTVAKLVHNSITLTTRVVVQEGMTLAVKAGVKPSVMLQVLWDAAFGKQTLLKQIPGTVFTGDFETPRFSLRLAHKDVSLGQDLAQEMGAPMELAAIAKRVMEEGISRGWGEWDNLATFMLAEERAGIEVRE